jgi:hypothetical protein
MNTQSEAKLKKGPVLKVIKAEKSANPEKKSSFTSFTKKKTEWRPEERKAMTREFSAEKGSSETGISLHYRSSSSKEGRKLKHHSSLFSQNIHSHSGKEVKDSFSTQQTSPHAKFRISNQLHLTSS